MRKPVTAPAPRPLRAVIYARYSTDEQRPESIEDQVRKCRGYCDQRAWDVVGIYSDAAQTGATDQRPDYQRLLRDAGRGMFEVVVVEAIDRLSRRTADASNFYDQIEFRKVKLHATDFGEMNSLLIGVIASMGQAALKDLKAKTKRGLTGKIMARPSAGSIGYGYRVDPNVKGKRIVHDGEAAVVRRIVRD